MADRESNPTATLRKPAPRRDGQGRLTLTARAIKVTLVLDPAQLAAVRVPDGVSAATSISPISAHAGPNCSARENRSHGAGNLGRFVNSYRSSA